MKLYIKNMVCSRCKMVVGAELTKLNINPLKIDLGEVEVENIPSAEELKKLDKSLKKLGFERIDDKKSRLIEKIKTLIVKLVHYSEDSFKINLSEYLSSKLHYDYKYLSNLFSEVEDTTIEKYLILQKVERVKELLVYDELSLSDIADMLSYSSPAYLSTQFKKVTGFTPSHYKKMKEHKRRNIEDI